MQLKRRICAVVILALLLSMLPGHAVAAGPVVAQGNHEKWIDRIADLPDYARSFYSWLEANTGADGALADPSKGTRVGSSFVHQLHELKGTIPLDSSVGVDQVQDLIMDEVNEDAQTVISYAFEVYGAFDRDHPEVFWLDTESLCGMNLQYSVNRQNSEVSYDLDIFFYLTGDGFDLRLECYRDVSVIAAAATQRDLDIQRILAGCPVDGSVAEQVRYLNRALTQSNAYNSAAAAGNSDAASPTAWKCVSALSGSAGSNGPVCEGYARAFKVLCDRLGIPCVLTEGFARGGVDDRVQLHMWNYVQIDGKWYAVDVTWNDPRAAGSGETVVSGRENEKYLLIGSQSAVSSGMTFAESHHVRNGMHSGSTQYTNGPVLSAGAYELEAAEPGPTVSVPTVSQPTEPEPVIPQPTVPEGTKPVDTKPDDPGQSLPENYMDITPYRSESGYTAPVKDGFVFAGWFVDAALTVPLSADATTGYAYAGFVDAEVLTVKCQITHGTTAESGQTDLRLLTGISTLHLQGVTFHLSWEDTQLVGSGLYEQVQAGGAADTASDVFGQDAAYIMTCTVTNVPRERFDDILTITPGWYTLDGTFVTGTTRTVCISDGL